MSEALTITDLRACLAAARDHAERGTPLTVDALGAAYNSMSQRAVASKDHCATLLHLTEMLVVATEALARRLQ